MSASYPSGAKTFTTRTNGQSIDASHIDDLQDEVRAIEVDLVAGLPVARGGTGLAAGTSGGVLAFTAAGTLASSAALTNHGVVLGGGAGAVPTSTAAGTSGYPLIGQGASAAPIFAQPAAVQLAATSKADAGTSHMLGFGAAGATITPTTSGRLLIMAAGYLVGSGGANNASLRLYTGTGGAPANGAALTGTARGTETLSTPSSAAYVPITLCALVTGLTVGTAYWIDLALIQNTGPQTITVTSNITAVEV